MSEHAKPVYSDNKDWFTYTKYWGTYSRVLFRSGGKYLVETAVSLTPVNNTPSEIDDLREVRIRQHGTSTKEDSYTHQIPIWIENQLKEKLGDEFAHLLIHVDLLSEFDHFRMTTLGPDWNNGGIPFIIICKDRSKYPFLHEPIFKILDKHPFYLEALDEEFLSLYRAYKSKE